MSSRRPPSTTSATELSYPAEASNRAAIAAKERRRDSLVLYLKKKGPQTVENLRVYFGVTRDVIDTDLTALRAAGNPVRIASYVVTDKPGPPKRCYGWGYEPDVPRPIAPKKPRKSKPKILQKLDGPAPPGIDDDEFERQRLEMLRAIARTHVPKRDPLFAMYSKPQPEKETT